MEHGEWPGIWNLESPPPGQDQTISYIAVYPGIYRYIPVYTSLTDLYWYISPYTKQAWYIPVYTVAKQ